MNKKYVLFTGYMLFVCCALFSTELITGTLELDTGFLFGKTSEYVYKGEKTISRLDWEEQPFPTVGIHGQLTLYNFFFALNMLSVLPLSYKGGTMSDYDYLLDDSDALSNYSEHDLYTDKHFTIGLQIGYTFIIGNFEIAPLAGFSYYTRKWSAVDGYLQYPEHADEPWTENTLKQTMRGTGIGYEQVCIFLSVGFTTRYTITPKVTLSLSALFYPYTWVEAIDSHFIRLKQFYDTMEGGIGYRFDLSGFYYLSEKRTAALTIGVEYEAFTRVKGQTSSSIIGITNDDFAPNPDYNAGTDSTLFSVKLGIRLNFGRK